MCSPKYCVQTTRDYKLCRKRIEKDAVLVIYNVRIYANIRKEKSSKKRSSNIFYRNNTKTNLKDGVL